MFSLSQESTVIFITVSYALSASYYFFTVWHYANQQPTELELYIILMIALILNAVFNCEKATGDFMPHLCSIWSKGNNQIFLAEKEK